MFALKMLERTGGIPPVHHIFSCDHTPACRKFLKAAHDPGPEHVYDDVENREVKQVPYCAVYIWGPPCQSFSSNGKRKGVADKRGTLARFSLRYIKHRRPKLTIMDRCSGKLS